MRSTFCQTTIDPVFRYLMSQQQIRDSVLTAILGERVENSRLHDVHLNPLPAYQELRALVNRPEVQKMMEALSDTPRKELGRSNDPLVNQAMAFMYLLAPQYFELASALPDAARQTELDVICETAHGWVEIEMQIEPQNYFDIRILDHVCGLFHRQFGRGFAWSQLEKDNTLHEKIKRVIGVSIFRKPPIFPERVQLIFPWYNARAWEKTEIRRQYRLCDLQDLSIQRPGIEFMDFNLEGYLIAEANHRLGDYPKNLCEWLAFFASAHTKTERQVLEANYSAAVQDAYKLAKKLPDDIYKLYEESLLRQANISHYVESMHAEGRKIGLEQGREIGLEQGISTGQRAERLAIVQRLKSKGLDALKIAELTGLSEAEIQSLEG